MAREKDKPFDSPINKESANRRKIDEALARSVGSGNRPNGATSRPSSQPKKKPKKKDTVYRKGSSFSQHGDSTHSKKKY